MIIVFNLQTRGWLAGFRWFTQSHAEKQ